MKRRRSALLRAVGGALLPEISLVARHFSSGTVRERTLGTTMRSAAELEHMARILQGLAVWGCMPGTPGERAGIAYGDIVLSVNGVRTSSVEEFVAARKLRQDGARVLLFRNGKEVCVDLPFEG